MTTFPRVNLNGTSGEVLMDECKAASDAVYEAIKKLQGMTIHGRDFQTVPNSFDALMSARREHNDRVLKLMDVRHELDKLYLNLDEQMAARHSNRWYVNIVGSYDQINVGPFVGREMAESYAKAQKALKAQFDYHVVTDGERRKADAEYGVLPVQAPGEHE